MSGLAVERIIGAIFLAGASACGIAGSIVLSDMVEDINRVSPAIEQENPMGWYFGKLRRVTRKYRTLYPEGTRGKTLTRLMIMCPLLVVASARLIFGPNLVGF
jgi:hypothetical protein